MDGDDHAGGPVEPPSEREPSRLPRLLLGVGVVLAILVAFVTIAVSAVLATQDGEIISVATLTATPSSPSPSATTPPPAVTDPGKIENPGGTPPVEIPTARIELKDYEGKTAETATAALKAKKFVNVQTVPGDPATTAGKVGRVYGVAPTGDVRIDQTVTLTVHGAQVEVVDPVEYVGLSIDDVRAKLEALGFTNVVAAEGIPAADSAEAGLVYDVSPRGTVRLDQEVVVLYFGAVEPEQ